MGLRTMQRRPIKVLLLLSFFVCVLVSCERSDPDAESQTDMPPIESIYDEPGLSRYHPVIELSMAGEHTIFIEGIQSNHPDETLTDNRWLRLYEDVLGIKVVYDWIEKGDLYHHKLGITLSSGNIPDVVKVDATQLRLLTHAGGIQDITEVYEKYASDLTKQILTQEGMGPFDAATINGKLMALPQSESSIEKANVIWIRTDWLSAVGLPPPSTMQDLLEISKAFAEKDPNRNGVDDTYGLAITNHLWDQMAGVRGFFAGFGAYPEIWIKDEEGKLVYGGIQPEVKEALAELQRMYRAGELDKEFALKNSEQVKQDLIDGKIGMMYGEQWGVFHVDQTKLDNPGSDWKAFPIVSNTGEPPKVPLKYNIPSFFAVRAGYDYPEAIIKMFNLFLEKNWGETAEYEKYYNDFGSVWQFSPVTPTPARKNLDAYRELAEFEKTRDKSKLSIEANAIKKYIDAYRNGGLLVGWGWERVYGPSGAFAIIDQYEKNNQLLYDQFTGAPTETMIDRIKFLNDMQNDAYINIILGESVEAFDRFVEQWRLLGGDRITQEVNEWYALEGRQY